jgi:outer membrane biosynthesis protein TonB
MKNTLLITASVVALLAGIGLASAQGLNERRDAPAGTTSEQKAPPGENNREKSVLPQKTEKMKPAPTAQGPETTKPAPSGQAQETVKPAPAAHAQETVKPLPTVQEKTKPAPTAQAPEKTEQDRQRVGQSPNQGAAPNAATQKGSKSFAAAPMSSEQNVKFRETLKGEKTEHLTNVKFSISIGEEVPSSVRFHRLPARIVEYAPQYRDFDYILVGDDILIVDPATHRIVAVISA